MDDPVFFIFFILAIYSIYYVLIRPVLRFEAARERYNMGTRRIDPEYNYHGNYPNY